MEDCTIQLFANESVVHVYVCLRTLSHHFTPRMILFLKTYSGETLRGFVSRVQYRGTAESFIRKIDYLSIHSNPPFIFRAFHHQLK